MRKKSRILIPQKASFSMVNKIICASVLLIRSHSQSPIRKWLQIICSVQLANGCALEQWHYARIRLKNNITASRQSETWLKLISTRVKVIMRCLQSWAAYKPQKIKYHYEIKKDKLNIFSKLSNSSRYLGFIDTVGS